MIRLPDLQDPTRVAIGRIMSTAGISFAVVGAAWMAAVGRADAIMGDYVAHNVVAAVGFGAIAWFVVRSQPRNGAIWVLAWASFFAGLFCLFEGIVYQHLSGAGISRSLLEIAPAELPLPIALVAMTINWLWLTLLLPLTLGFILFPTGRAPSRRWRAVAATAVGFLLLGALGYSWAARPSQAMSYEEIQSVAWNFTSPASAAGMIGYLGMFVVIVSAVWGLIARFRTSAGLERQQYRWVVWGAGVTGTLLVTALSLEIAGEITISQIFLLLGLGILIASYGVAIAKYRLYDIDVVISRAVVLAVLAAFITGVYALVVVAVGTAIGGSSGGLALPIAATGLVAVAFEPVRLAAQRWANHLVFGRRATPYQVLADLTNRLAEAEQGAGILARLARLLADGTGAERASVWLGEPGSMQLAASWPVSPNEGGVDLDSDAVFPVRHTGEIVGALEIVKPRGTGLSTAEKHLVGDLAGSAGLVLGYHRLNDALTEMAADVERSRRRLVEAQDDERRRLERELHDGAQQLIVGLKVKLGLASRLAEVHGADDLQRLLHALDADAQAALEEVRSLARGIYPPVLQSDGLGPAVSGLAAAAPVEVTVERDGIGSYPRDVEAAVYFNISEAVTNAVKHAHPPIRVSVSERDGVLMFRVTDQGPGFDVGRTARGSGLANMSDRLDAIGGSVTISSSLTGGTTVTGNIPVSRTAATTSVA